MTKEEKILDSTAEYYRIRLDSRCYLCSSEMEYIKEEVDIGVGIQAHVVGFECPQHGRWPACYGCGLAEDGRPHMDWCSTVVNR